MLGLRPGPEVSVNREIQNDRAKLIMHRMVARRLKTEPELVDQARHVLDRWKAPGERIRPCDIEEWEALLRLPVEQLRTEIVRRTHDADRLRSSSPFSLVPGLMPENYELRKRIWRIAKKGSTERFVISNGQSRLSPGTSRQTLSS
jgi:hypothetical protein